MKHIKQCKNKIVEAGLFNSLTAETDVFQNASVCGTGRDDNFGKKCLLSLIQFCQYSY